MPAAHLFKYIIFLFLYILQMMQNSIPYNKPDCADFRSVARTLTIIENDLEGADELLKKNYGQ